MASFTARLTRIPSAVRGVWATQRDFSDAVYSSEINPSTRLVKFDSPSLAPDTDYYYCVEIEGSLYPHVIGQIHTRPTSGAAKSFKFWAASCAGSGGSINSREHASNHPVFDGILSLNPDFGIHLGDMHYGDIGRTNDRYGVGDYGDFLTSYQMVLNSPSQRRLYRKTALQYIWDDHDYGPNNSDSSAPGRDNVCKIYRDVVPHPGLALAGSTDAVYYFFDYGRCRFIMLDNRSERDPNSDPDGPGKSMLGSAQKTWFKNLLSNSPGKVIFIVSGSPWSGSSSDNWPNFSFEREELADHIKSENLMGRLIMVTGDHHNMGIDDGTNNDFSTGTGDGGFAVGQFAPLSSSPSGGQASRHSEGLSGNRRGQFGLIEVEDDGGDIIAVTMRAMRTLSDTTSEVEEAFSWTLNADVSGS